MPPGRLLRVDPGDELVGNAFRRELLVAEHVGERLQRQLLVGVLLRVNLRQNLREPTTDRHEILAALCTSPRHAVKRLECLDELFEEAPLLQATLDASDDEVIAEADIPVELGEENLTHRVWVGQGLAALDLEGDRSNLSVQLNLPEPQTNVLTTLAVRQVLHERIDAALAVGAKLIVLQAGSRAPLRSATCPSQRSRTPKSRRRRERHRRVGSSRSPT